MSLFSYQQIIFYANYFFFTWMVIAALFKITQTGYDLNVFHLCEQINKMWCISVQCNTTQQSKEQTTHKCKVHIKPLCWGKKARPKSVNTNYSENANIVINKTKQSQTKNTPTLGGEGCTAIGQDGTFEGSENVLYVDCSYSFTGICMCRNASNCRF